ncbi:GcrA family cell cycle regulator [Martelella sp. HB161492]|uniref:GcrA family cell cycle regulator n=1 Tax=Martelella sp. HB161492 TaxID=2720726 RepID=UPI00159013BA|nr:GcrA family cell cycle regulator [Martelella sp. HB161492]
MMIWTDEKIDLVGGMIRLGKSQAEIGAFFGVPKNAIAGLVSRNRSRMGIGDAGIEPAVPTARMDEARAMWADGASISAMAAHFGVGYARMANFMDGNRDAFPLRPPEDQTALVEAAAKLWDDGLTINAIAHQLGISRGKVCGFTERHRERFLPRGGKNARVELLKAQAGSDAQDNGADVMKLDRTGCHKGRAINGAEPVLFRDLDHDQCHFPLTDIDEPNGPDMPCCGLCVAEGRSYCTAHMKLAYRPRGEMAVAA